MQVTTGVDIIEVDRIKEAIERLGDRFLNQVYTENEISYCSKKNKMKYQHYAARFAAKEAVFKALSKQIDGKKESYWKKIEVLNEEDGRPIINMERLKKENMIGLTNIDISISHIKDYAMASAVAIFHEKGE